MLQVLKVHKSGPFDQIQTQPLGGGVEIFLLTSTATFIQVW